MGTAPSRSPSLHISSRAGSSLLGSGEGSGARQRGGHFPRFLGPRGGRPHPDSGYKLGLREPGQ